MLALMGTAIFVPAYRLTCHTGAVVTVGGSRSAALAAYDDLLGVTIPYGVRLDDYVRDGLEQLRIMLVQHARRR